MLAPGVDSVARLAGERSGQITRTIGAKDAPFPFFEFGWNHTTLHALKHDKTTTYLQSVMEPDNALELVKLVQDTFGPTNELAQHLEVVNFGGRASFASLALLWPSGEIGSMEREERLKEILSWHEANGMPVFDPHTHILEDGGMKQTDWAQLGFKRKVDPNGILNPGKMRAWEEERRPQRRPTHVAPLPRRTVSPTPPRWRTDRLLQPSRPLQCLLIQCPPPPPHPRRSARGFGASGQRPTLRRRT